MIDHTTAIGSVAQVFNGKTPSKKDKRDAGSPVLKIKDVGREGVFSGQFESFVDHEFAEKYEHKSVRHRDTLILNAAHNASHVGSKVYQAEEAVDGSLAVGEWTIVRPDRTKVEPELVYWWLKSAEGRRALRSIVKGLHLYPKDVSRLDIPLPPPPEQRWIVDILNRANGIRRLRKEAQEKARQVIPALFVEMFGDPVGNPKGWEITPLGELASIGSGVTKGRKLADSETVEVPYLRVANVQADALDLSELKTIPIRPHEMGKYALEENDLLMTEGGDADKLGRCAIWNKQIDPCIHQNHVFRVRCDVSRVLPEYVQAVTSSHYGREQFLRLAKRTTGIASINKTQLSSFRVPVPPLGIQEQFVRRAHALSSMTGLQERSADRVEAAANSLLAQLFTT